MNSKYVQGNKFMNLLKYEMTKEMSKESLDAKNLLAHNFYGLKGCMAKYTM